jgi:hypothetical protein
LQALAETSVAVRINSGVQLNEVGRLLVDMVGCAPKVSALYLTSGMDGDHGAVSHQVDLLRSTMDRHGGEWARAWHGGTTDLSRIRFADADAFGL